MAAVGIVGSDVYDTLVVLQAMRPVLKESIFFSTDLDNRFLHPREEPWTRNTLLASGFGFTLAPGLQHPVMLFRDTLQTAYFASTLFALGNSSISNLVVEGRFTNSARLFEIGRGEAVDLSTLPSNGLHESVEWEQGSKHKLLWICKVIGIFVFLCLIVGFLAALVRPLRRMVFESHQFDVELLCYKVEDFPDTCVLIHFTDVISSNYRDDPLLNLILDKWKIHTKRVPSYQSLGSVTKDPDDKQNKDAFVDFLNGLLREPTSELILAASLPECRVITDKRRKELKYLVARQNSFPFVNPYSHKLVIEIRKVLDDAFKKILEEPLVKKSSQPGRLNPDLSVVGKSTPDPSLDFKGIVEATLSCFAATRGNFRERQNAKRSIQCVSLIALTISVLICLGQPWIGFLNPSGEQWSLWNGTSAWPTEMIRGTCLFLCLYLIQTTLLKIKEAVAQICRRYFLPFVKVSKSLFDSKVGSISMFGASSSSVDANETWKLFQHRLFNRSRFVRSFWLTLAFLTLGTIMVVGLDQMPSRPVRGTPARILDLAVLVTSVFGMMFLCFLVIEVVSHCRWLIEQITEVQTRYGSATREYWQRLHGKTLPQDYLDEWLDMQIVADLTEKLSPIVYYPFVLFSLMMLARSPWWDRWTFPPVLIAIFSSILALTLVAVVVLRRAAKKARSKAQERLEAKLRVGQVNRSSPEDYAALKGNELLDDIKKMDRGAFSPLMESSVVGATLLPPSVFALAELLIRFVP